MPVLLLGIGVFAVIAGLVMIGFGIPINEFSFGNTLISAGTTASIGGLIIIAVGMAVRQLRLIVVMLGDSAYARLALPSDEFEPGAAVRKPAPTPVPAPVPAQASQTTQGRVAYPPRSKERPASDPSAAEAEPAPAPFAGERADQSLAPSLRNPDEASLADDDDISLSPRHPQPAPASAVPPRLDKSSDTVDWRTPPAPPATAPQRPPSANFDAMWPAENKAVKGPPSSLSSALPSGPAAGAPKPEPKADALAQSAKRAEPDTPKPRTVAILKSGVVDGMGYTLYVDGSIEAELPQGTLRFASINELRSHLEKNS